MAETTSGEPEATDGDPAMNRKRAALAVLPFLAIGVADIVLILQMGVRPLWGFAILPPILFICVLAWVAFRSGFTDR